MRVIRHCGSIRQKLTGIGLLRKLPFTCSRCHGKRTGFITKRKISRENIRITRRACTIFRSRVPWHRLHIWMCSRAKKFWIYVRHRGGKSTQIAAAMQGKGLLVSNEIHPARAKILSENMERMGVKKCDGDKRESADTCRNVYGIF